MPRSAQCTYGEADAQAVRGRENACAVPVQVHALPFAMPLVLLGVAHLLWKYMQTLRRGRHNYMLHTDSDWQIIPLNNRYRSLWDRTRGPTSMLVRADCILFGSAEPNSYLPSLTLHEVPSRYHDSGPPYRCEGRAGGTGWRMARRAGERRSNSAGEYS